MPDERSGLKARLVIHKMVLVNVQSYVRRQEIGLFHKVSFRFIMMLGLFSTHYSSSRVFLSSVGPNGSGKSNTIDALLFVFSYRASKYAKPNSLNSSTLCSKPKPQRL